MSTIPTNPPANPVPGAVYADIATNRVFVWTGTGWVPSTGATGYNSQITTGAAILPGYFPEPDPSSYIAQVGSEPLNPSEGQIWVDDTVTPSPAYVWHDGAWFKLTDGTFTDTTVAAVPPASPDTGDTYYETATSRFYVWDGTAWKAIGEGDDTNSIFSMSTPALRPSGSALQAGDLWVNSVTGVLSYYNGATWTSIGGGTSGTDTHSMAIETNGTPLITTRTDGTPLQDGDQVVDTGTNQLWYYDLGVGWKAVSGATSGSYYMSILSNEGSATGRPDGGAFTAGDVVYEQNVDANDYFEGIVFVDGTNTRAIAPHISTGITDPDSFSGRTLSASCEGDLHINKTNNSLWRYDGASSTWVSMSSGGGADTHAFTGTGAPTLTTRPDTTALQDGDFYVDDSANAAYYYDLSATTWKPVSASAARATPFSFGTVFGYTSDTAGWAPNGTTALGFEAGNNTSMVGISNTLIGEHIGISLTTGQENTLVGWFTGRSLTTGSSNTALGTNCLDTLTSGSGNIAIGYAALNIGTGYSDNIAIGKFAANELTDGSNSNIMVGSNVGQYSNGVRNVLVGNSAGLYTSGSKNVFIGEQAGCYVDSNNSVIIGKFQGGANQTSKLTVPDGTVLLARNDTTTDTTVLRINENNAYGIPATNGSTTVDYGTAGQVLTSRGTVAPPHWTAKGSLPYSTTNNFGNSSGLNDFALDRVYGIVRDSDLSRTLDSSLTGLTDADVIGHKIILVSNLTLGNTFTINPGNFGHSGVTGPAAPPFSWTPSRVGEVLTIEYVGHAFTSLGHQITFSISQ